jgi:cell division protein ZapB
MEETPIRRFSSKVEQLLTYCEKLEADNAMLRAAQEQLQGERSSLLQKNDLAKNKIEAMIGRLRALEQN